MKSCSCFCSVNHFIVQKGVFLFSDSDTIIDKTVTLFKTVFEEIIIVTNSPEEYGDYHSDCIIVSDQIKNAGPLGGIHSALSATQREAVFFVACDMFYLHNDIIISQINDFHKTYCDALVPRMGNSIEPLHAVYRKGLKKNLSMFLKRGDTYSVRDFLRTIKVRYWDVEDSLYYCGAFQNFNTPEDIKKFANKKEKEIFDGWKNVKSSDSSLIKKKN